MSVKDLLAKPKPEAEEAEIVDPSQAYGMPHRRRDREPAVEFRFADPAREHESLDYSWLPRVSWCEGQGRITLRYPALGITVTITGNNLFDLKEKLRKHQISWVQEQGRDTPHPPGQAAVYEITFEEDEGEEES